MKKLFIIPISLILIFSINISPVIGEWELRSTGKSAPLQTVCVEYDSIFDYITILQISPIESWLLDEEHFPFMNGTLTSLNLNSTTFYLEVHDSNWYEPLPENLVDEIYVTLDYLDTYIFTIKDVFTETITYTLFMIAYEKDLNFELQCSSYYYSWTGTWPTTTTTESTITPTTTTTPEVSPLEISLVIIGMIGLVFVTRRKK